ncbi:MAG: sle [Conexibacter sp.]|nr:sle [Conexibacter sp.]
MTAPRGPGDTSAPLDRGGLITVVDGSTFCLSDRSGDIGGDPQGLFFLDARLVSRWELRIDGVAPEPLSVAGEVPFHATFVLRAPAPPGRPAEDLLVLRRRWVGQGMREDLELRNHAHTPVSVRVEVRADADFDDLLVVKGGRSGSATPAAGELMRSWGRGTLRFGFVRGGRRRDVVLTADPPGDAFPNSLAWQVIVPPHATWHTSLSLSVLVDGVAVPLSHPAGQPVEHSTTALRRRLWRSRITRIATGDEQLEAVLDRSLEDLGALRTHDPEFPDVPVVAAGAPWYMTLFGRDALVTAWSALLVDPELALGVLQTLARLQGHGEDPGTAEQPGRILHEVRTTESASGRFADADLYYGTVDAPALFVMLLGEVHRWGLDPARVQALVPAADACLAWMERTGEADGILAYAQPPDDARLRNQGWKDSDDGVLHEDGTPLEPPIALVEPQAYAIRALRAIARLLLELDATSGEGARDRARAAQLAARANALEERLERFWVAHRRIYGMGIDGDGRTSAALASNQGHLLWSEVLEPARGQAVRDALMSEAMFSGWGLRTLGRGEQAYNPVGYHLGTVWPHDTAMAAVGLRRYGFDDDFTRVFEGLLEAASHTYGYSLPELFAGFSSEEYETPVPYPVACHPQAWASGAIPYMLVNGLGLKPDGLQRRLRVRRPSLPRWVNRVDVEGLAIGNGRVDLRFERTGGGDSVALTDARIEGDVDVVLEIGPER